MSYNSKHTGQDVDKAVELVLQNSDKWGSGSSTQIDTTLTKAGQAADAAAVGERLSTLSENIVTTSESKVAAHNTGTDTHSDIRLLIQGLSERLSAVADSDDATLDQLSEIVAYIKSNKSLIDAITTSKVGVADIIDNLTTNVANKPLSAAQGVAIKALIDALTEAMPGAYTLPIASSTQLGGVQPAAKTDAMTQAVGVDAGGALWTAPGSGEGGGTTPELVYSHICDGTYVSVTDDLPLEDNKIYATFMFLPKGTEDAYFYCRIGSSGNNTYTGAVSGYLYKQHSAVAKRSCVIQAKLNGGIACLSVFTPDTNGNSGVYTQDNKRYTLNKIYIYSSASDANLPEGLKVEVYKLN